MPSLAGSRRTPRQPEVHVVRLQLLAEQSLVPFRTCRWRRGQLGFEVGIVVRALVKILRRRVERRHRIPVNAGSVFLHKKVGVLVHRALIGGAHNFVFVHVAGFFLPVAPHIEEPVGNAGVAQLQCFCEIIEFIRGVAGSEHWNRSPVEPARRIGGRKRRSVGRRIGVEKSGVAILVFVRKAERGQNSQVFQPLGRFNVRRRLGVLGVNGRNTCAFGGRSTRHPHKIEINHLFIHLRHPAQIENAVIVALQSQNRIAVHRIVPRPDDTGAGNIAVRAWNRSRRW